MKKEQIVTVSGHNHNSHTLEMEEEEILQFKAIVEETVRKEVKMMERLMQAQQQYLLEQMENRFKKWRQEIELRTGGHRMTMSNEIW